MEVGPEGGRGEGRSIGCGRSLVLLPTVGSGVYPRRELRESESLVLSCVSGSGWGSGSDLTPVDPYLGTKPGGSPGRSGLGWTSGC